MADEKVNIIVQGVDKASGVLRGIGDVAKTALGVAIGQMVVPAFKALTGEIASFVTEAMAAEDIEAQLNAVLESTGGIAGVTAEKAGELADSLSQVTRFEDDAILSGENLLLTFTGIGKDVFPQATETMLNMSQALGQDLKSSAIQLGKALQDPILGVTALRRVGVNFNEAQIEMIKSMVEAGDVMGAQKFILAELETEFGGAAKAAGETFAGKLDILKNKIGNIKEAIGKALIPILTKLLGKFSDFVSRIGPKVIAWAEAAAKWLGPKLEWAISTVTPIFERFAFAVKQILGTLFDAGPASLEFREALSILIPEDVIDALFSIGGALLQAKEALVGLWDNTADAREGIATWFSGFKETLGEWATKAVEAWDTFKGKVSEWWEGTAGARDNIAAWFNNLKDNVLPGWVGKAVEVWDTFKTKVGEWWDGTADARGKIGEWYNKFKDETLPKWKEKAVEVWDAFKSKVGEWWDGTADARGKIVEWYNTFKTQTLPQFLSKAAETWNVFKNKVQEWWDGTADTRAKIVEWYDKFKTETLPQWQTKFSEVWEGAKVDIEEFRTGVAPYLLDTKTDIEAFTITILPEMKKAWEATTLAMDLFKQAIAPLLLFLVPLGVHFGVLRDNVEASKEKLGALVGLIINLGVERILSNIEGIVKGWGDAMNILAGAILWVIAEVGNLANALSNLTLPDWLTPGSPTPFELGLRGINDALKDLLPNVGAVFTYGLDLASAPAAAVAAGAPILPGGMGGSTGGGGITIINNFGPGSVRDDQDIERITRQQEQMLIRRGVRSFAV
ncbi:MAG: hypothetical protein EHM35_03880 [Planctomycetaceae bacterium]|nr:MAG: hypothetical protein EHM35_03880 [Planctomycetaceae bacterium]